MDHNERAGRLEKWLQDTAINGTLETTVADPKPSRPTGVTSAVFGPTTMFTVTTKSPNDDRKDQFSVERSLNDFITLRTALVQRFPGAVLGHLPESRVTDLAKSKEEKTTKQGEILGHFLHFLCRHPFISQDQVFLAFLSATSKFPDALRAVAPMATPAPKFRLNRMLTSASKSKRKSIELGMSGPISLDPVSAADWWREAIDLAAEPADPLRIAKDVLGELDRVRKRISDLKVTVREFREKLKSVGNSCNDLHKSFKAWLALEHSPDAVAVPAIEHRTVTDQNGDDGEGTDNYVTVNMSMPILLQENAIRFQKQGLVHHRMAQDSTATLLSAIREEILVLDAMKEEVIGARDAVLKVEEARNFLDKKERDLQILEEQARAERGIGALQGSDAAFGYEEASDPTFERKTRAARKARDEALAALETASAVASTYTRATLNLELNFFREERIVRSDKFFAEFAKVHAEYSAQSVEIWTMRAVEGIPAPPVNVSARPLPTSHKRRIPSSLSTQSVFSRAGIYEEHSTHSDDDDDDYHPEQLSEEIEEVEKLVEWDDNIPWDQHQPRLVQVEFDFDPEHEDEVEGRVGDRGMAVPYDEDRQWIHIKMENGESGIIPTDFVRVVTLEKNAKKVQRRASQMGSRRSSVTSVSSYSSSFQEQNESRGNRGDNEDYQRRIAELESEMERIKSENERLRQEATEHEVYIQASASELESAKQTADRWRIEAKNLALERDQAIAEKEKAIRDRDQAQRTLAMSNTPPAKAASRRPSSQASPADDELPPNWIRGYDKKRDRYFYHNTVTKESVWKRPTGDALVGSKRKYGEE